MTKGYGVLRRDNHLRVTTVEFKQNMESRLCIPNPNGDGSMLTIVTRLNAIGTYEFIVEDAYKTPLRKFIGNIYTDAM